MSIASIYLSVSLALLNAGWMSFALWRINRNEDDVKAICIVLFCLMTVGISAIAVWAQ